MADTARTAADAEEKSAAAAQPLPRVPIDEATVNHNFQILGDAEVQFAKATGQNGSFYLADFAPIFLYRGGDNILFEAGELRVPRAADRRYGALVRAARPDHHPAQPGCRVHHHL